MRVDRLLKAAAFIDTIPLRDFDLALWGEEKSCGFVGCAMGHVAQAKIFRGFTFDKYDVSYGRLWGWQAVEKFFELNGRQAMHLFSYANYLGRPKPGVVAARIRDFVRTEGTICSE